MLTLAGEVQNPAGLEAWLRSVWQFVADPEYAEYIKTPVFQFHEALDRYQHTGQLSFTGDCDDASTLGASILTALEVPNWFTAIRMPGNPEFEHVFVNAWDGTYELQIDPVVPAEEMPIRGIAERMELDVWPIH